MHDRNGCKVKVTPYGQWFEQPCSRKATKDGYCTQHHPDSVKKRHDKQAIKYEADRANSIYGRYEKLQESEQSWRERALKAERIIKDMFQAS